MIKKFSILYLLCLPLTALADLTKCSDGVWRSNGCEKKEIQQDSKGEDIDVEKMKVSSQKKSLFHDLTMKNIKSNAEYKVKLDLSEAETVCLDDNSTLDQCKSKISVIEKEIEQKVKSAQELQLKEKSVRAQEEANKIQEERNLIEASKPSVVIVEPRRIIKRRDYFPQQDYSDKDSIKIESNGNDVKVEINSEKKKEEDKRKKVKSKSSSAKVM